MKKKFTFHLEDKMMKEFKKVCLMKEVKYSNQVNFLLSCYVLDRLHEEKNKNIIIEDGKDLFH